MEALPQGEGIEAVDLEGYIRTQLESKQVLLMTHLIVGYPSVEVNRQMLEISIGQPDPLSLRSSSSPSSRHFRA